MLRLKLLLLLCLLVLLFSVQACTKSGTEREAAVFKELPEIKEIRPEKTVKIKLKRSIKDDYSWEINGDDAGEVIKADKQLRESMDKSN